jgi:hypothetical protein
MRYNHRHSRIAKRSAGLRENDKLQQSNYHVNGHRDKEDDDRGVVINCGLP